MKSLLSHLRVPASVTGPLPFLPAPKTVRMLPRDHAEVP